ncbi:MAG: hypothetical protein ACREVN_06195 [Gammaproteobacteria bacterium]
MDASNTRSATIQAIILTSQRTGSTFLVECLDSHPGVVCGDELLIGMHTRVPKPLLRFKYAAKAWRYAAARAWFPVALMDRYFETTKAPVVAFKAMYSQVDNRAVRRYLRDRTDIRIIHLRRDNLLKQYVSRVLLRKKRGTKDRPWRAHVTSRVPSVSTRISPPKAIAAMRKLRDQYRDFDALVSRHRKIELVYERMFGSGTLSREAWDAVGELLELGPANVSSDLVKLNPTSLRAMVENYDELAAALAGTEFERHLDPIA